MFNPFGQDRGDELKQQLVRAAIAGMEAIRLVNPRVRFAHVEPAIHVLPNPEDPASLAQANANEAAQYDASDMLSGKLRPELGGPKLYGSHWYILLLPQSMAREPRAN